MDVSVLITCYNSAATILETLDSVNTKCPDFTHEIIIVDDGSTDNTCNLVQGYRFEVPFKLIRVENNFGRPFGLNIGAKSAMGTYIAILDSDDVSTSHRLNQSFKTLKNNPDIDLIAGQCLKFGEWGRDFSPMYVAKNNSQMQKKFEKGQNPIMHSSVMFRRTWIENIGYYDERLPHCPDFDLFLRGFSGTNFYMSSEVFFFYRTQNSFPSLKYFLNSEKYRKAIFLRFRNGRNIDEALKRYSRLNYILYSLFKYCALQVRSIGRNLFLEKLETLNIKS